MKKLLVLFLLLISTSLFAQKITEKKIVTGTFDDENSYWFSYDENSEAYAGVIYDSVSNQYYILSNKGKSVSHSSFYITNLLFDSDGNYYVVAEDHNDTVTGGSSKNYFVRNGKDLRSFDYINENMVSDGRYIYFLASDSAGDCMMKYDTRNEQLEAGKKYEYITLCYSPEHAYREIVYTPGLTKNNKVYYEASKSGEEFLVIGDDEQKHYQSIDANSVTTDLKGNLCYIATKAENDVTYSLVVQGSKEYDKCFNARGPVVFNDNNVPVYAASDKYDENYMAHNIFTGNEKGKFYAADLNNVTISPSGKIAFIATETVNDTEYTSYVVCDGKEGKRYENVYYLLFTTDEKPVYAATKDSKTFVVIGSEEQKDSYSNITELLISPGGQIYYVGENDLMKDSMEYSENYFHINGKVFGPYNYITYSFEEIPNLLFFDDKDNYAYLASDDAISNDDSVFYKLYTNKWQSDSYTFIDFVNFYEGNTYYTTYRYNPDLSNVYKNKTKLTGDYQAINNYKFKADDGEISFVGLKNHTYYYVKIGL